MAKIAATLEKEIPAPSDPKLDRRMKRARLIRGGMSWRKACLLSGYSQSVADRGPRGYVDGNDGHRRPGIMKDFERAAKESTFKPEFMKAAATHRLMTAILEGRSSDVAREIEIIGKFKENDWFVNPTTGTTIGIFAHLAEPGNEAMLDENISAMKNFREGGEFACAWCNQDHASAKELQTHSLTCAKRPIPIKVQAITNPNSNEPAIQ